MKSVLKLTPMLLPGVLLAVETYAATPPTPRFDIVGFIQEATLDTTGAICTPDNDPATGQPSARLRGGTMMVNGQKLIIPCNTVLQLPAATMMWADLFDPDVSAPIGTAIGTAPVQSADQTGLALADNPMYFPSFDVRVQGNIVNGQYIAGLIAPISQQGANASSGLISYIDYTTGAFRVGGVPNDPDCAADIKASACSGALVQINDPVGRWGLPHSPDPRFSGDYENSTVTATTGIPVCIPRVAPPEIDPECPLKNRPVNGSSFGSDQFLASGAPLRIFTMPTPAQADADPALPDPRKQVPMMVGDQVDYAGTLYKIDPAGPNTAANTYISAHTLNDHLGIFTAPGVPPAYVNVEEFLIGTNGAAIQGINQEATSQMTVVGYTTDPTRPVDIYAQDINACTGEESLRLLATTDPSTQVIKGLFVHQVLGGEFMPPTRNYVMKSQTQQIDPETGQAVKLVVANGIVAGQFLLPNFEFIFPENHTIGDPLLPFNFQDMPFLAQGSGPVDGFGTTSSTISQLDPWPGSTAPAKASCVTDGAAPIANAGADITATTGDQVTLKGAVTQDSNSVLALTQWTQTGGTPVNIINADQLAASFTPSAAGAFTFRLSVTDQFGSSTDDVAVTVAPAGDTVAVSTATWQSTRGTVTKLVVEATTNDPTATLSLTETGMNGTVYDWGIGRVTSTTATMKTFSWRKLKGIPQPAGLTVKSSKGGARTVTCGAPNAKGTVTCQ